MLYVRGVERFITGMLSAAVCWLVWDRLKGDSGKAGGDVEVEDQIVRAWLREKGAVEVPPLPEVPDFVEPPDLRDPFDDLYPDEPAGEQPWYLEAADLPESIGDVDVTADMNGRATYLSGDGKEVEL
jgi:hypothetical protein